MRERLGDRAEHREGERDRSQCRRGRGRDEGVDDNDGHDVVVGDVDGDGPTSRGRNEAEIWRRRP